MNRLDPRCPAVPVATEEDPDHVVVTADGQIRRHYNQIFSDRDTERIRTGYCCINCGESQYGQDECPFPEKCWLCGFEMRERQLARFAQEFVGTIRVGPSTSIEDELAIAEEMVARERRKALISVPSIVIPRSF